MNNTIFVTFTDDENMLEIMVFISSRSPEGKFVKYVDPEVKNMQSRRYHLKIFAQ